MKTISGCGSCNAALYQYNHTWLILGIRYTFVKWNLRNGFLMRTNAIFLTDSICHGQMIHTDAL